LTAIIVLPQNRPGKSAAVQPLPVKRVPVSKTAEPGTEPFSVRSFNPDSGSKFESDAG